MLHIRLPHRIALDMFRFSWQCTSFAFHLSTSLFIMLIVSSRRILPSRDAVPVGSQNTMQPRRTPPRCQHASSLTLPSARTTRRILVFASAGRLFSHRPDVGPCIGRTQSLKPAGKVVSIRTESVDREEWADSCDDVPRPSLGAVRPILTVR